MQLSTQNIQSQSFWIANNPASASFSSLKHNLHVDTAIIGAGITGLTTAYFLLKAGKKVAIFESGNLNSGDSAQTSAHLTYMLDTSYRQLIQSFGKRKARLAYESHRSAIDRIEEMIKEHSMDCDFDRINAYLFLGPHDSAEMLEEERKALYEIGVLETSIVDRCGYSSFMGSSLKIPNQARFHITKYMNALAKIVLDMGGEIYSQAHIETIEVGKLVERSSQHQINCQDIVVATHSPVEGTLIFLKEFAYRSYVIGGTIPKGSIEDALYWDTADPYHYVRLSSFDETSDLLIVGGADHKTGQPYSNSHVNSYRKLELWAKNHFPQVQNFQYRWSGQIIESGDGLAFIGRIPYRHRRIYMATGFSGNGMTYSNIAGLLISDLILGRLNPWADLYDPTRKVAGALKSIVAENLNSAKNLLEDWLIPSKTHAEDLKPGQGAIVQQGLQKVAAYRDDKNQLHLYSAICPHLGCIVHWNDAEKTFDCPCHGSRFNHCGQVIHGPAVKNLDEKKVL